MSADGVLRGGVNTVRRVGDTVHRPATAAAPAIHRLLRHLRAQGFDGAPAPLGFDRSGEEVLTYLHGDVHQALPPELRTGELLESAAVLLRRLHDATADFSAPPGEHWNQPPRSPAEVVCHGDTAPYNCVVRGGRAVGFIDFDTAHPGPRLWDLAYAVYRFAPLQAPTNPDAFGSPQEQGRRAAAFCRAYGHQADARLLDAAAERLRRLLDHMRERAAAGDAAFQTHLAEGHAGLYETDIAYLGAHRAALLRAFAAP
ncbi:aminoglycoside phosphotransferase family protein [Streptomonospora sp. PA3]|uniref:phosphotransferase enzyme family protein n=1 Tax=Streptomonospora sp. PA3 TaxID=2607326 RepID=UPI0012DC4151|nr:aminoglycoside phosphotransferase family protein [Streptomonospora sp. PA3]MUL43736.1 aminoglycoside phosphotransferase family protein [Streptomonospora sp. PA3]